MKKLLSLVPILALLVFTMGVDECDGKPSAEQKQANRTERLMAEMDSQIGMPAIKNFYEKRLAKQIFELRDDSKLTTYTYIVDMNGKRHLLCNSIGYGLPYSVQYTNPEHLTHHSAAGYLALPQADPNGLYMPDGLSATWVICVDDKGNQKPVYVEPTIIVSPFRLDHDVAVQ
jgi:hypothetical protein